MDWEMWWKNRTYRLMGNFAVSNASGDSLAIQRLQQLLRALLPAAGPGPAAATGSSPTCWTPAPRRCAASAATRAWRRTRGLAVGGRRELPQPRLRGERLSFLTAPTTSGRSRTWCGAGRSRRSWYRNWCSRSWAAQQQYNFDGDRTAAQFHAFTGGQLSNYWNVALYTELYPDVHRRPAHARRPAVAPASGYLLHARMNTDSRKTVVLHPAQLRAATARAGGTTAPTPR